ncbi:ATP-binding protein [Haloarchaeobius sp. DYHT-AS-18]|uniref:ATP-binding protein n=1 Tax=Haloarchaeobius sp. DYHT-AS-18 TaxID=3446117 RepID=UPI003EBB3344
MDVDDRHEKRGVREDAYTLSSGRGTVRFRHLLEHIQDAVVEFELVGGEPIVRGFNASFVETFGYDEEAVLGGSLNDLIVPSWLTEEATELDGRTDAGMVNYRVVRRQTADSLREFLYRGIPSADDDPFGFAIYTDLTDTRRKERRLEVLNRLLRHNLRNQVNVIAGYVELLEEQHENQHTMELLACLAEAAENLNGLTQEAGAIDRALSEPLPEEPRVDCVAMLERLVDRSREEFPHAVIRTQTPSGVHVAATERLEAVLAQLVENAILHNPAAEPRVWLEVHRVAGGDWVDVVVADDGPKIPVMEHETVTGDSPITATSHGAGLGLWLVRWTVQRFGGVLSFGTSDAGGNRVQLRLRRADGGS